MNNMFEFDEDEIGEELMKLGYVDIPSEQIKHFKNDLETLVKREQILNTFKDLSSNEKQSGNMVSLDKINTSKKFDHLQNTKIDKNSKINSNIELDLNMLNLNSKSTGSENSNKNNLSNFYDQNYRCRRPNNGKNEAIENSLINQKKMDYYKKMTLRDNHVYSDENSSSCANTDQVFKRKICRKINGHRFVEESTTDDASVIGSTSRNYMPDYEELHNHKIRNNYEMASVIYENENTKSVLRPNSSRCYHKKCDPVKRYHLYKEAWQTNKAPGEKAHKQLRWDIRAQMYYSDELPIKNEQLQRKPNSYIIPTEKKRENLCWKI